MGYSRGNYNNNIITFTDTVMSPTVNTNPWSQFPLQAIDDAGTGHQIKDDFISVSDVTTTSTWQIVKGTGAAVTLSATKACGWINIPTAASANDYQCFFTQEPTFFAPPVAGYLLGWEAYVNVTEGATNASSWFAGFTSTTTTGFLTTSGVPPTTYSGAVIYKTTGGLAVNAQTSNATTQHTSASAITTAVSATSLIVGMSINTNDGVTAIVTWYVSTVASNLRSYVASGTLNLTLASLSKMYFGFGIQAGSGGTAETLTADYVQAAQGRYYI